jgi:O-antigen/teichoic acid export membrane protein
MRNFLLRYKFELLVALGLLLLPLVFFWPVAVGDRTLLPTDNLFAVEPWRSAAAQFGVGVPHNGLLSDLVLENYPWKKFILESLDARQVPLWNPYQFAGLPFLAAGQHSALYPFSILFYVLPLARAYGLFTVSQFFLAGLFMYVFLRSLGLGRVAGSFGAIAYQFSLFMVVSVVFTMIIAGVVWLPLILTCVDGVVRQRPVLGGRPATIPWVALGAGAMGLQILAGHAEITYYTFLVAGAYSAWRLAEHFLTHRAVAGKAGPRLATVRSVGRKAVMLLLMAGLGIGLGAVQLIPLFEVTSRNFRSGSATFGQIVGWAYPWRHALLYLVPNLYGNPSHHGYFDLFTWQWTPATVNSLGTPITTINWDQAPFKNYVEGGTYLGVLPLFLVGMVAVVWLRALRSRRAGRGQAGGEGGMPASFWMTAPFFLLLTFASLAFIFPTRLYALIFWLPGINQVHSAFRWVWPLTFSVATLGAYGIRYLQASRNTPSAMVEAPHPASGLRRIGSFVRRVIYLDSTPSLITTLAVFAIWAGAGIAAALVGMRVFYARLAGIMDRLVARLTFAQNMFADGRMAFSYEARWILIFALMLIAAGIVLRVSRCPIFVRGRPVWEGLALAVITLDLFVAGWGFNPAADPAPLAYTPPSVRFLKQDTSLWRFTTFDNGNCRPLPASKSEACKPFNANLGWYFNLQDIRGYDSVFSQQYRRYMELIQPQGELDFNRIAPISDPGALNSPLLDLLNVKYVITQQPIDNPKYTLVYSAEVQIYQNLTAMPRAFTLPQSATLAVDDLGQAVQQFDPRQYVMVAPRDALGIAYALPAQPTPVTDINYTPNEVTLTATVSDPAWLILADSYFPGWKAYIRPAGAGANKEQEISIALVDGNFRGVTLPPGAWTVRFRYSPLSTKVGGIVSFTAGVLLLFALAVWLWRYFYRESATDSTARRLAKNSLTPMALQLMNRGITFVFAMFYLRVLGPVDVGRYTVAAAVWSWFDIVTNYGLNVFLTREASRDRKNTGRYFASTTLLRLLLGVAAIPCLAVILGARQLLPNPLTGDTLWAIGLLVIGQAPATISYGLTALFYVYEKAEYPAAVATITTILTVALGTIALVLGLGFVGLAGVSIIANLITLAILGGLAWRLFLNEAAGRWQVDWGLQRGALSESFPLMLNHLLATLFFKVDVPLLQLGRGDQEVGWYGQGYKYIDAFNIIPSFFTQAFFPIMSRQAKEDRAALLRSYALAVKLLVAVALPLALVTACAAPLLVGILAGAAYLPYGAIALAIVVWSIPFGWINSVTNYLLVALDQQRGLTRAFAVSLVFNVVANLIFIPRYGYVAAAVITVISELFEGAWFYWYLRRSLGPIPWVTWLWRLWAGALLAAGLIAALWRFQPVAAVAAGLVVYAAATLILTPFTADERAVLAEILPGPLRRLAGEPKP